MAWKRLTKKNLPPIDNDHFFLLCRGYKNPDDQLMHTAKRVMYDDQPSYIRYVKAFDGWEKLPEEEYKNCLWQEIEYP